MKLEDAYFGIMLPNPNKKGKLEPANLFGSMRVLRAIAIWKTKPETHKGVWAGEPEERDVISWCFSDTRARCEYEWIVSPWGGPDDEAWKVDVYGMYVEPNRRILAQIIDDISVSSCQKWLRAHRR